MLLCAIKGIESQLPELLKRLNIHQSQLELAYFKSAGSQILVLVGETEENSAYNLCFSETGEYLHSEVVRW